MTVKFEMPDHLYDQLGGLKADCGFKDDKELFNNALTLLQWAVVQTREGKKIGAVNEEAEQVTLVELSCFDKIREKYT